MVDAAPFRALRYDPAVAGDPLTTSAPAYDDIDRFDYARHRTASPYTVLELLAPSERDGYAAAGAALARWQRTGVLALDHRPAFYAYEQRVPAAEGGDDHVQRGVLAAVVVEPGTPAQVLPHEDVDPRRVASRSARLQAVPVDLAPVYTVADAEGTDTAPLLAEALRRPALVALTDEAGTRHRVVAVTDPGEIARLRAGLAGVTVLIADGHHRYAAAVALRRQRPHDPATARTLMLIVDASSEGPRVLPVHRLLPGVPPDFQARLAPELRVRPAPADAPSLLAALAGTAPGTVALRLPGAGFLLEPGNLAELRASMGRDASPTWRALEASLIERLLLPRLGVPPSAIGYRADLAAVDEIDRRGAGALVLLRPVDLDTVRAVAVAGERMPAKTTSFRPKPRTGLVLRPLA